MDGMDEVKLCKRSMYSLFHELCDIVHHFARNGELRLLLRSLGLEPPPSNSRGDLSLPWICWSSVNQSRSHSLASCVIGFHCLSILDPVSVFLLRY